MKTYDWAVIGGGPAGILAVGKLLDANVHPKRILWLDPAFKVGDFGQKWHCVSSNTTVALFHRFLAGFNCLELPKNAFPLYQLDPNDTCLLSYMAAPLQWATNELRAHVTSVEATVTHLALHDRHWHITTDAHHSMAAHQVILATGADPHTLALPYDTPTLSLEKALDPAQLAQAISPSDQVAVIGSSHSAMIILQHLLNLPVKTIYNFYLEPCRFAINMGDWILFDNTGLKGNTAQWTKEHINGRLPSNLVRHLSTAENIEKTIPQCDHVIYATGFKPRQNIEIEGLATIKHHPHSGIIAPGLFGLGIGFPELVTDPLGNQESSVGLWKFMHYLERILPIWQRYTA